MKVPDFGIICEVNPMHNGHAYLIERAREMGADRIVCIMSGNTVQRGEFAIADKYIRAEAEFVALLLYLHSRTRQRYAFFVNYLYRAVALSVFLYSRRDSPVDELFVFLKKLKNFSSV